MNDKEIMDKLAALTDTMFNGPEHENQPWQNRMNFIILVFPVEGNTRDPYHIISNMTDAEKKKEVLERYVKRFG